MATNMELRDTLRITWDQNPAAAEAYRDAREGQKIQCEVKGTIKTVDAEGIDLVVDVVIPDGYEESANESPVLTGHPMNPTQPVPSVEASSVRKIA